MQVFITELDVNILPTTSPRSVCVFPNCSAWTTCSHVAYQLEQKLCYIYATLLAHSTKSTSQRCFFPNHSAWTTCSHVAYQLEQKLCYATLSVMNVSKRFIHLLLAHSTKSTSQRLETGTHLVPCVYISSSQVFDGRAQ